MASDLIKINNVDQKLPKSGDVIERIIDRQIYRQKEDLNKWSLAVDTAEDVFRPDRTDLERVFKSIGQDAHLKSVIKILTSQVLKSKFDIFNEDGTINEELNKRFKKKWFKDWIKATLERRFHGFALVQFGAIVDSCFESVKVVPPENVLPDVEAFKPDAYLWDLTIPVNTPPVSKWTILLYSGHYDLGLLNDAVPLVLWKRNAVRAWSTYADIFGMPLRIGKTDITDPTQKRNMDAMLANVGQAAYGVFDTDDTVEFIEATRTDAFQVYNALIERMNGEISKLFLSQTMTSDNGSSRSQAEVHERILDDIIGEYKEYVIDETEGELFPFMRMHGILPEGVYMKFDTSEQMDLDSKGKLMVELLKTGKFKADPEYLKETFDIQLEEVEEPEEVAPAPVGENIRAAVNKLYNEYKPHVKHRGKK